jgi:uncharacterized protein YtpQ (UPF0354 family)
MKSRRRELLKLACGVLAGAGLHRAAAGAQKPTFRDADRTRDKIVALVRSFGSDDPRAMSVENFRRLYPGRKIEYPLPHLALVTDAGDLEPCLMLDAGFWEKESQRRGSAIVAAAPARDVLMFSDRSARGNVDILKKLAVDVYASVGKEALSKTVFLWNYGRWEACG